MRGVNGIVGVVAVASVLVATAVIGALAPPIEILATGMFAATAAVALVAYRDRGDPALLLVGTGSLVYAAHVVVAVAVFRLGAWGGTLSVAASFVGPLVLGAALVAVVPWSERRGRAPLAAGRVAAASAASVLFLDALALLTTDVRALEFSVLGWLCLGALAVIGAIVLARSLADGGRSSWLAAAGLALTAYAVAAMAGVAAPSALGVTASNVSAVALSLAAASLLVFVLASLRQESTRLRRVTDRAEEVLTGRAEIAALVAHDVRGPVSTIKGFASTTLSMYDRLNDAERREFVELIELEAARLLRIVNQVALGLKVDARTVDLVRRPHELGPLVARAVDAVEADVTVDVEPGAAAVVDGRWFVEVVQQGLDNALSFSPAGAAVELAVRTDEDAVVVEVADRGPGVPAERVDEVFSRFVRWRPDGYEDRQGAGLGLFIVRGLAEAHGGSASIEARPSGGSILRVRFPVGGAE
jgi:signal transduction histidine kinase